MQFSISHTEFGPVIVVTLTVNISYVIETETFKAIKMFSQSVVLCAYLL